MRAVCRDAAARGVVVGAQVSYRDRENFGRRHMDAGSGVLTALGRRSRSTLLTAIAGGVRHPRGLPQAARCALQPGGRRRGPGRRRCSRGSGSLPVLGLPGSAILRLAAAEGRTGVREGFPDRGYTDEGRLVPRDQPGALVEGAEAIAANAVEMAAGGEIQSLCVHGDSPGAVEAAAAVRSALVDAGYDVRPWAAEASWLVHRSSCPQDLWTTCGQRLSLWTMHADLWASWPSAENGRNNFGIALVPGPGRRVEISSPQPARVAGDRMNTAGPTGGETRRRSSGDGTTGLR